MKTYEVVLIAGDGIGPEVTKAALRVIEKAGAAIEWKHHLAGLAAIEKGKETLPQDTLEASSITVSPSKAHAQPPSAKASPPSTFNFARNSNSTPPSAPSVPCPASKRDLTTSTS